MRLTRYHLFLLGGLFLMVMGPLAFTQPGPGGGKGGKGGGKGGKMSPDFMFMMMSGGNDTFEVAKVELRQWPGGPTVDEQKQQMLTALQQKGVTNGVMTKAVFADYWEQRMTEMRAQREAKMKDGGTPAGPGGPPASSPEDAEAKAREMFARMDTDKNGSLSVEEIKAAGRMGQRLGDELAKWDTNKNGTIELPEYIAYSKDRAAQWAERAKGNPNPAAVPEPAKPVEDEKRPVVFRTGKLPKELPSWFEEADKDKDGQVGLYEWKATNKPVRDFLAMDLNGDGFLTVEEVLRYQRASVKATTSATPGAPPSGTTDAAPTQRGRGPGGPGGGRNGGGRNGGTPKGG